MPNSFGAFVNSMVGRPVAIPVSNANGVTTFSDGSMAFEASPDTEAFTIGPDPTVMSGTLSRRPANIHLGLERPEPPPLSSNGASAYQYEQRLIDDHIYFEGVGDLRCCTSCGAYRGRLYRCPNEHCNAHDLPMTGSGYAQTVSEVFPQTNTIGQSISRGARGRDDAISQFMSNQRLHTTDSLDNLAEAGWVRADGSVYVSSTIGRPTISW